MKIVLFVLVLLAAIPGASAAEPAKIKLATLAPKGTSFHQILLSMGEKWQKAPGGGVKLVCYTDGTMGGEADMVRRMRVGQVQAGLLTVAGLQEIDSSVTALQTMPMKFHSLDEVEYVREKLRPRLEKTFLEKGFVVLFWCDAGWVRFFSRKPATVPADLKPMKLFAWAGDNRTVDLIKAFGYRAVPLEPTDILAGLQTGLIDAVPSTPTYALAGQFYGPASNMVEVDWAPLVGGAVITKKAWDALPADARDEMMKAAAEAGKELTMRSRAESDEAVEAMKKRGLKVQKLTPAAEAEWRKLAEDVNPKIRGALVPADLFDEVQQLLKDYRASSGKS